MKKALFVTLLIALFMVSAMTVSAKEAENAYDVNTCTLKVNGFEVEIGYLFIKGEVYLNLRETVEALGGMVYWYPEKEQICIVSGQAKVFIDLKENIYLNSGEAFTLSQGLTLIKEQNYLTAKDIVTMLSAQ